MDLDTLRTDTRYLISPQLTSADYPDADLDRNLSRAYKKMLGWIIPIGGEWEMQGDIIYNDVQPNVTDYVLPSMLLRIYKGEIKYSTDGDFVAIKIFNIQANQEVVEGNITRTIDNPAAPTGELFGDVLQVRPAGEVYVQNGIKLWVQTSFADFSADNNFPDLMDPVQRGLSLLAALDYAIAEEMDKKAEQLRRELYGDGSKPDSTSVKKEVEALYSVRSGAHRDGMRARRRSYK